MAVITVRYHNENHGEWPFERKTAGASAYDLCAAISCERFVAPGERWAFRTGVYLAMPIGVEAQVRGRSGLALNHGIMVFPGTVDSDYRGEIRVTLLNTDRSQAFRVAPGMRIAQLAFCPVMVPDAGLPLLWHWIEPQYASLSLKLEHVDSPSDLGNTERGAGGHGSTGL